MKFKTIRLKRVKDFYIVEKAINTRIYKKGDKVTAFEADELDRLPNLNVMKGN